METDMMANRYFCLFAAMLIGLVFAPVEAWAINPAPKCNYCMHITINTWGACNCTAAQQTPPECCTKLLVHLSDNTVKDHICDSLKDMFPNGSKFDRDCTNAVCCLPCSNVQNVNGVKTYTMNIVVPGNNEGCTVLINVTITANVTGTTGDCPLAP